MATEAHRHDEEERLRERGGLGRSGVCPRRAGGTM